MRDWGLISKVAGASLCALLLVVVIVTILGWEWLGSIADSLSIITAAASLYAAWKIGGMSARFAFNVRAGEVLGRLDELRSEAREALKAENTDWHVVKNLLLRCDADVRNIQRGASGDAAKFATRVGRACEELRIMNSDNSDWRTVLWDILNDVDVFCLHARDLHENRQIGATNDS